MPNGLYCHSFFSSDETASVKMNSFVSLFLFSLSPVFAHLAVNSIPAAGKAGLALNTFTESLNTGEGCVQGERHVLKGTSPCFAELGFLDLKCARSASQDKKTIFWPHRVVEITLSC